MCVRLNFLGECGELLTLKLGCELGGWHLSSYAIWIQPFNSCTWPEPAFHFPEPVFSLFIAINFFSVGFFAQKRNIELLDPKALHLLYPSCRICTGSLSSSSGAAPKGTGRGWDSPALPNSAHSHGIWGAGSRVDAGWGARGVSCSLGRGRQENTGTCQGSPQCEVAPSLQQEQSPWREGDGEPWEGETLSPSDNFQKTSFAPKMSWWGAGIGQSLLCFGVMAMKDSSGVGNAQEEIGRHSKYSLDFVD